MTIAMTPFEPTTSLEAPGMALHSAPIYFFLLSGSTSQSHSKEPGTKMKVYLVSSRFSGRVH